MRFAALFSNVTFRQLPAVVLESAGSAILDPGFGAASGPVTVPLPPGGNVSIMPILPGGPADHWRTNMPMLPGGPKDGGVITLPAGEPGSVPGSPGEVHILPVPVEAGEVHILPFPLPGAPASLIPWGSWIGL